MVVVNMSPTCRVAGRTTKALHPSSQPQQSEERRFEIFAAGASRGTLIRQEDLVCKIQPLFTKVLSQAFIDSTASQLRATRQTTKRKLIVHALVQCLQKSHMLESPTVRELCILQQHPHPHIIPMSHIQCLAECQEGKQQHDMDKKKKKKKTMDKKKVQYDSAKTITMVTDNENSISDINSTVIENKNQDSTKLLNDHLCMTLKYGGKTLLASLMLRHGQRIPGPVTATTTSSKSAAAAAAAVPNHPNTQPQQQGQQGQGQFASTIWTVKPYVSHEECRDMLRIAYGVGQALLHMHRYNLLHGDLKPENIVYDPETGQAYVIDLGSCIMVPTERYLNEMHCTYPYECYETLKHTSMSPSSTHGGTRRRSSEERRRRSSESSESSIGGGGSSDVTSSDFGPANDVWSLGMVMFSMVRGRHPSWTSLPHPIQYGERVKHDRPQFRHALFHYLEQHRQQQAQPQLRRHAQDMEHVCGCNGEHVCLEQLFVGSGRQVSLERFKSLHPDLQCIMKRMVNFDPSQRPTMSDIVVLSFQLLSNQFGEIRPFYGPQPPRKHKKPISLDYLQKVGITFDQRNRTIHKLWMHISQREQREQMRFNRLLLSLMPVATDNKNNLKSSSSSTSTQINGSLKYSPGMIMKMHGGMSAFTLGVHIFERYCCLRADKGQVFEDEQEFTTYAFLGFKIACHLMYAAFTPIDMTVISPSISKMIAMATTATTATTASTSTTTSTTSTTKKTTATPATLHKSVLTGSDPNHHHHLPDIPAFLNKMRHSMIDMITTSQGILMETTFDRNDDKHNQHGGATTTRTTTTAESEFNILLEIVSRPDYYERPIDQWRHYYNQRREGKTKKVLESGDVGDNLKKRSRDNEQQSSSLQFKRQRTVSTQRQNEMDFVNSFFV